MATMSAARRTRGTARRKPISQAENAKTIVVTVTASKAREEFSSWISTVSFGHKWIVLKRHGKAAVAMVPMADLKILRDLEDEIDLRAARAAMAEPGETPWETVKEKLGI